MRRLWIILAVVVVVVVVGAVLLIPTPMYVRQELGWIDSISGSRKAQTAWRWGATSTPIVSESVLATRYRELGLQWEPDWKHVKGTYIDIFGGHVGTSHGWPAPEIYSMALSPDLQRGYLAASSDADVRAFFHVMSSGTREEQRAAVEAACDQALGGDAARGPGE